MAALTLTGLLCSPVLPGLAQAPASEQDTGTYIIEVADQQTAEQIGENRFSIGDHEYVKVTGRLAAQSWQGNSQVLSVEPLKQRRMTQTPNDADFSLQWHHYELNDIDIDSTDAWDTTTGSSSVIVAVVDSGVDLDHEDLADNIWVNTGEIAGNGVDDDGNGFVDDVNGWDFVDSDNDPNPAPNGTDDDADGQVDGGVIHGTHVAGLIGAVGNNSVGGSGVNWDVSIMAVRALDDEGYGNDPDIAQAVEYAADNGASVINLSLGAYGNSSEMEAAVQYAIDAGVLVMAAAGNDAVDINVDGFYPACSDGVVGVAATNAADTAASFSNYGSTCVDIAAPGASIFSTLFTDATFGFTDSYGYLSGTSMATPIVSGAAALIKASNSGFTDADILDAMTTTADDIGLGADYGAGRLNVANALEGVANLPTIQAWTSSNESVEIDSGERTNEKTPFFSWSQGIDVDGIAGYWVYFGKDASADAVTSGTFQTSQTFQPNNPLKGNDKTYYLRVKIQDALGNTTNNAASFEYRIDVKVKKPKTIGIEIVQGGLRLSWTKVSNEHVNVYRIRRSKKGKDSFTTVGEVSKVTTYFVDKTAGDNKSYDYKIRTIDNLGNISNSQKKTKRFYGIEDIVAGAGAGHAPQVVVYDANTDETLEKFSAYASSMTQGVEVAVGDVDGDGVDEIVTGTGPGAAPQVRVFEVDGTAIGIFYAYDSGRKTGVRVGTADTNNDGVDEIVTVPGPGAPPLIRRFTATGQNLGKDFYALNGTFTGGAFLTGVDFDGDHQDEIAVAAGPGGGAQVTVNNPTTGAVTANFFAYDKNTFKGGIRIARADTDASGGEELVTVPAVGTAHVQLFTRKPGEVKQLNPGFFAFDSSANQGFSVAGVDVDQNGHDELVIGTAPDLYSEVVVYNTTGTNWSDLFYPFDSYTGANVAGGYFHL